MASLDFIPVLLIAVGLSADCFAVAISGSLSQKTVSWPQLLRLALSFGLFQAFMPVLGWLAGQTVVDLIAPYDHWVAFALLSAVGIRMVWESFHSKDSYQAKADITKGLTLLTLSVATSIDALAVGLTFAFLAVNIVMASSIIGATALVITASGCLLGVKAGRLTGRRAEAVGGLVLIAIGLKILISL